MEANKNDTVTPCEPASTRRHPVSGPDGVKLVTEGDGGVECQASPGAATTTGPTGTGPGPVQSRDHGARTNTRRERQRRRQRERKAAAASGAMLVAGNGRDDGKPAEPAVIPPTTTKSNDGKGRRFKAKERRRREAELLDAFYQQKKDGIIKMPDVTTLAPAVAACMARMAGTGNPGNAGGVCVPESKGDPCTRDAEPGRAKVSSGRGRCTDELNTTRTDGPGTSGTSSSDLGRNTETAPSEISSLVRTPSRPSTPIPAPCLTKGKGVGKGRKGSEAVTTTEGVMMGAGSDIGNREEDPSRGSKRQRSTDQISPSGGAAADKKVCLEGGTAVAVANPRANHRTTARSDGDDTISYAEAARLTRVVIIDRAGVAIDENRATLLRKIINRDIYEHYKANRDKPKQEWSLPSFAQGPRTARGGLLMVPNSEFALAWLRSMVEQLPLLWEGSGGLEVILEKDLPKYNTAVIYVPDFGEDSDHPKGWSYIIRDYIANQNRDIDIEKWPIFTHVVKQRGECFNHVLVMGIPPGDMESLRRKNFRLSYTTGKVFVKVKTNTRKGGTGKTANTKEGEDTKSKSLPSERRIDEEVGDNTASAGHIGMTEEEVELLLQVDDEGAEDFLGVFRNLNVLSPASLTEAEKPGPSSSNQQDMAQK